MNVERFLLELMYRFGGSEGLAEVWHEAFVEAAAARRLRACESIVRLVEWLSKYPDVVTGAAELEDAQLQQELQEARIEEAARLIKFQPEVAAVIAAELGYELRQSSAADVVTADPTEPNTANFNK
jgi:hypothetical protein